MLKKRILNCTCFLLFFISANTHAKEYQTNQITNGPIHVTTIQSSWCWNLAVSTKVGILTDSGKCNYIKETQAQGVDTCDALQLNGYRLERNAGSGFNCAATHVHSNETNRDGLDEYTLIADKSGHYINTTPTQGNINLN
jgi:hypothetical protein